MRQKILFLVSFILLAVQGWAAPVDLPKAQAIAQSFASANGNFNAFPLGNGVKLAYAEQSNKLKDQPVFYVFNTDNSYVIVAGDDRAEQILAYGDGQFDINDIPCGMRCMLNIYREEIEFLQINPKLKVEKNTQGTPSFTATSVSPLLSTNWGQGRPYNNYCPKYGNDTCLTGCVATAMAQIMQYWSYPSSAPAMNSYTTSFLDISVDNLPKKNLSYNKSKDAIAWLMRYAGQSVEMDYTPFPSIGSLAVSNPTGRNAMVNKFKYSSSAVFKKKSSFNDTQWHNMLKTELNANRPVYYRANDDNGKGGHAFIIDGYNSSGKYHINWGGSVGYYSLNAFNVSGLKFNTEQQMIIDLRPRTVVTVPSSHTFSSKTANKTYTWSFTVKGTYLTGGLTLKLTGATGVFSIDKTSITKSAATSGATVTVTYKPTTSGTQTATITISGGGLTANKTISLKGTSVVRKITPSVTSLAFGNRKLYTSTKKTFRVTGTNLTGPLTLKVTGASDMFLLDKTSITASQAASGAIVTVTFKPTAVGPQAAKITISGGDAESSKTIKLTGKGISNGGITPYVLDNVTITNMVVNGLNVNDFINPRDNGGNGNGDVVMAPSNPATDVNELMMNAKVCAEGQTIIIESPMEQSAMISDIAGHALSVELQAGHNEIPVNASGVFIVRIREKTTKLILK